MKTVSARAIAQSATAPAAKQPAERFRWWVVLVGSALIPVNSLWIARAEALDYSGFPTCASLFYNVVFTLMVLLGLNVLLRRCLPKAALCRRELIVIYAMLATGSSLVGHDTMQMLVPSIPHASHFATPENGWGKLILPNLPDWLTIKGSPEVVSRYEQGHSTLYSWENIRPWLVPMGWWTAFLLCSIASMLSLNLVVRRHWVEHERLTYPIAQIPILITDGGGSNRMFRNRLLWIGFAIAASIDLLNGFAQFFPALPTLNVKLTDISYIFQNSPNWRVVGWTPVSFYPFVIGLAFFMPTDMAFSCWFFYLFRKAEQVTAATMGYQATTAWYPYLREQSYGALIVLFIASLWRGRGYLAKVWKAAVSGRGVTDDEGISYRLIFSVLILSLLGTAAFLAAAGMSLWLALIYVVLYILFLGALTRMRAELGPASHEFGWVGTSQMIMLATGTAALGPQNLGIFSLLYFQNRMHRGVLMPQQAECLKASKESGLAARTMAAALAIAGVIGVVSAFWALLHLGYTRHYASPHPGAPGSGFAQDSFNTLASWLNSPVAPNHMGLLGLGIGAVAASILARLSVMIYGFPFHPAGYAIGMSFGMDYIWLPVLISWAMKALILRYAGLKGYRVAIPFFVGLVLGEFVVGGFWSFVRGITGIQTYTFFIF